MEIPKYSYVRQALSSVALFVLLYLVVWLSIDLTRLGGNVACFWPANALVVTTMLKSNSKLDRCRHVLLYALANYLANLNFGDPNDLALLFSLANSLEIIFAFAVLRRYLRSNELTDIPDLIRYIVLGAFFAPLVGGILGALVVHGYFQAPFLAVFSSWWTGDAVGMILVGPVLLGMTKPQWQEFSNSDRGLEALIFIIGTSAMGAAVFVQNFQPLMFVLFVPLMVCAIRLGLSVTALATTLVSTAAVWITLHGMGPVANLGNAPIAEKLLFLQVIIISMAVSAYVVALSVPRAIART